MEGGCMCTFTLCCIRTQCCLHRYKAVSWASCTYHLHLPLDVRVYVRYDARHIEVVQRHMGGTLLRFLARKAGISTGLTSNKMDTMYFICTSLQLAARLLILLSPSGRTVQLESSSRRASLTSSRE